MTKSLTNSLIGALTLGALQFLPACQKNSQKPPEDKAPQGTHETQHTGDTVGTGDGGGGNGLKGKPLDSYAFDVTENPIWIKYFANTFLKEVPSNQSIRLVWQNLWKSRIWYVVPTSINNLPSNKAGTAYLDSTTGQAVAIQTDSREVWIGDAEFKALKSDDERAELLLFQFIMGLTTIARSSPQAVCLEYSAILHKEKQQCQQLSDKSDAGYSGIFPASKLTAEDYQRIGSTTKELLALITKSSKMYLTPNEILGFYFKNNFSNQFFSSPQANGVVEVSEPQAKNETGLEQDSSFISNSMLSPSTEFLPTCHVRLQDSTIKPIPCKISINIPEKNEGPANTPFIHITAEIDGKSVVTQWSTSLKTEAILWENIILVAGSYMNMKTLSKKTENLTYKIFTSQATNATTLEILRPLGSYGVSFAISTAQDPELAKKTK